MGKPLDYEKFLKGLVKEFPDFKIVRKADSSMMKFIDIFLKVVTFGQMTSFMTDFTTTVGNTVYVTDKWSEKTDEQRYIILRHERIHMVQAERHGRFLFSLMYLVAFFPLGLAWFRAQFELEAYTESMRALAELRGMSAVHNYPYKLDFMRHFTGPEYGWMWPFKRRVEKWYLDAIAQVSSEISEQ